MCNANKHGTEVVEKMKLCEKSVLFTFLPLCVIVISVFKVPARSKFSVLLFLPLSVMASGGPMMNGDISRSPSQSGTLEETLQQMNILIQENRDLKGESSFVWSEEFRAEETGSKR